AGAGQGGEQGQGAPDGQPQRAGGAPGGQRAGAGGAPVGRRVCRPQGDGQDGVEQDGAWGARQRPGAGEETAQAFAQPPDGQGPGDRGGQGYSRRGAERDAQA